MSLLPTLPVDEYPILDSIVGVPYAFPPDPPKTFDCWTLFTWVRAQLGLQTRVHIDPSDYDISSLSRAVDAEKPFWTRVNIWSPEDGDAVLFDATHIGVFLGRGVLHAHAPHGSVVFTKWSVVLRRWPAVEVWRP